MRAMTRRFAVSAVLLSSPLLSTPSWGQVLSVATLSHDAALRVILSPHGKHLGTIVAPEHPANLAWGDSDGRTLYMAARAGLYRIRLSVPGTRASARR
jgi:hypothetical protein